MKRYLLMSVLAALLLTISCGGGGDGSSSGGSSRSDNGIPWISVNIEPKTVCRGGYTTYTLEWYDSDGNIKLGHIKEEWGYNVYTRDENVSRVTGISGSFQNPVRINPAATPGPHKLSFWVTDAKGTNSNVVEIHLTLLNCVQGKDFVNGNQRLDLYNIY